MSGEPKEVDERWWRRGAEGTLPVGAPFRPGLDPIPVLHEVWAVVKDRWGRPAHGEPADGAAARGDAGARDRPQRGTRATYSTRASPTTRSSPPAACPSPCSTFTIGTSTCRASGAVVLVAALGSEVAREGRLRVGELYVLYPGVSNLLSPRAGEDPMHADFKIQGYETPDGSFAQFVRGPGAAVLSITERLTLPEGSAFMLDLETVYKALYDVARVQPGERVFVEGAAGGTGIHAVAVAALRGARVTGLVSTEDKGRLVLAARRPRLCQSQGAGYGGRVHAGPAGGRRAGGVAAPR